MGTSRVDRLGPYILLALTCAAGWLFKAHCGATWTGDEQYLTGCYSDALPFWGLRGVAAGQLPYVESRIEYPVLTGALIWLEGLAARTLAGPRADAADFLLVVSIVNAAFAFAVLRMMERAGVPLLRRWCWAAAPPLILYLGHNWDMLAVALAMAAILAARRGEPAAAAALAAIGTAAKLFPILLLPLLGLSALFQRNRSWTARFRSAGGLALVAVVFWGALNAPLAARAFENWAEFYTFSRERSGTAASVWEILAVQGWWNTDLATRNLWSFLIFAGGAGAIVAFGWPRHRDHLWALFTPVLAWFLLTNKVYSPQFDLWLYPFLLLTSRRLWPIAWFALGDVGAYWAEFWFFASLGGGGPGVTQMHIAWAAAFRAAALLWIIVDIVRGRAPDWVMTRAQQEARNIGSAHLKR
ncbi:glycosyltransferase 87 family protein [Sphingomonas sp. IC4-52]|uniref:glycosyltransferase 87 family protein n=1 Tax=Sphingomonas sp. IC4-52 TaxID=2887202 RepID=UPI001D11887F|nr:glycosyltransferase 87 family protein [Sphingomonas sp. IC4-52]MCC2979961.1 glycosyltransferase 87 family protein [Sphingomonas sp. IC4-52]